MPHIRSPIMRSGDPTRGCEGRLIAYLRHAHTMERSLGTALAGRCVLDEITVIRGDLDRHRVDCGRHAGRLASRLRAQRSQTHSAPDDVLHAWLDTALQAYDPILAVRALFTVERLKITAYELLEDLAAAADDRTTAAVAAHHRIEEEARRRRMARVWSDALVTLPSVATAFVTNLREASPGL